MKDEMFSVHLVVRLGEGRHFVAMSYMRMVRAARTTSGSIVLPCHCTSGIIYASAHVTISMKALSFSLGFPTKSG